MEFYIRYLLLIIISLFLCSCDYLKVHTPLAKSDAIVVLAGSNRERLPAAAMLYRDGYAPLVILANDGVFSRWSKVHGRNLYHVEWAEEDLVMLGVPREKIVKLPFYGSSTMFDAIAVKKYLFRNGQNKIILVTSDYHTRRALWSFKETLKTFPTEIYVFPAKSFGVSTKDLIMEYVKLIYYFIKYKVLGVEPDANEIPLKGQK